jgi:single-strand DNA-binding protein
MATLNKVMMMGRLTNDPEVKTLSSGTVVAKFRLVVGRSKKNKVTGQWENDPNPCYIDCEAYTAPGAKRDIAGLIGNYVKKGDQIYLEGNLQLDEWQDKNGGGKRSKHKIVIDGVELLGSKNDGGEAKSQPPDKQHWQPSFAEGLEPINDDIPF